VQILTEKLDISENNLDFGGNKNLRELLSSQGDLANELAKLELEAEALKNSERESRGRCEWAEAECLKVRRAGGGGGGGWGRRASEPLLNYT